MINKELLEILVCPEDRTSLSLAEPAMVAKVNQMIEAGTLTNRGGEAVEDKVEGALVREDRKVFYPIIDGIPVLVR